MEKHNLTIILTIAVLGVAIFAIVQNYVSSESFTASLDEVKDSINDVEDTIDNSMSSIARNQLAGLEQDSSSNFDPELKYRIFSISPDSYLPYSLRADITNMGDDPTFVKNKWTLTGDICNEGNQQSTTLEFSGRNSLELVSGKEKDVSLQLPPEYFTDKIPTKTGFLVILELEMNPYIPSIDPLGNIEFAEMTYLQYDFKEDRESWMPTKLPDGHLNCTSPPSIHGQVFLNTSSIYDFYDHSDWWEFPEE